jgi:hypothetical protein
VRALRPRRGSIRSPAELAAAFASLPDALAGLGGLAESAAWDLSQVTLPRVASCAATASRSAAFIEAAHPAPPRPGPAAPRAASGQPDRAGAALDLVPDAAPGGCACRSMTRARGRKPEDLGPPPACRAGGPCARVTRAASRAGCERRGARPRRAGGELRGLWCGWRSAPGTRCAPSALARAAVTRDHRAPLDAWRAWRAARRAQMNRLRLARLR